jgi:hypothetical protein
MVLARWQGHIVDQAGNVQTGAQLTVRRETAGAPLVSIYADRDGLTPLGNPFVAGADGFAAFHVAGGAYRIDAVKGAFARSWRYVPIGLAAEGDSLTTGISWLFDAAIADADPGAGTLRFNNAALAAVTQLYISDLSRFGGDVGAWLAFLDDNGTSANRGVIVLQTADGAGLLVATVTGTVVNGAAYRKVSVTPIVAAGSFAAGAAINVQFTAAPVAGVNGLQPGLLFNFDSATAMADPGNGDFRLNNAAMASVTAAAVDDLSSIAGNPNVSAVVLSWDDSTQTANRGTLLIKKVSAPQNFAAYRVSGASIANAGWTQLALAYVAHAGSFADGDACSVEFSAAANAPAAATETIQGIVEQATDAEIRSAAAGAKAIMAEDLKTASAGVALSDAATVAVNWDAAVNFTLTVAANRVIGNPTNGQPGTWRTILVQGNDAANRTLSFGNQFLGEAPTITDCNNGRWYLLMIFCVSATHFVVSAKKANGA